MLNVVQLMLDFEENKIINEPLSYWKELSDVPNHILNFIKETVRLRVLHDKRINKYYCPNCLIEIDDCCKCCNYKKPSLEIDANRIDIDINDSASFNNDSRYYVFDVVFGKVFLYVFLAKVRYNSLVKYISSRTISIEIENTYLVEATSLKDLLTNKEYSYKEYEKICEGERVDIKVSKLFGTTYWEAYIYKDSLDLLKNTSIYKYTHIWDLKDCYEQNVISLETLIYYPICCPQFEYLVKMGLYRLALFAPNTIEGTDFKNRFGVDKSYLKFMKNINISYSQLKALRIFPTNDINMLNFFADHSWIYEELSSFIELDKLKNYIDNHQLNSHDINEYYDYIECCRKVGFNLKDKSIIFPTDFKKQHDKLTKELIIANDPKINENIKSLASILSLNKYDDGKFVIFPADSIESLIDESTQMSNCVRIYCEQVSKNECQIYFMRYRDNINKSYITIEVRNNKIVQARTKLNGSPSKEEMRILTNWESALLKVTNC